MKTKSGKVITKTKYKGIVHITHEQYLSDDHKPKIERIKLLANNFIKSVEERLSFTKDSVMIWTGNISSYHWGESHQLDVILERIELSTSNYRRKRLIRAFVISDESLCDTRETNDEAGLAIFRIPYSIMLRRVVARINNAKWYT